MGINQSIKIENEFISEIKKFSQETKFSKSSTLYYEGQIPIVAYLLIEGSIHLLKNNKIKKILKPGTLIGLNELMTNSPSKLSAQVEAESVLCFLDKSTLFEIIKYQNNELSLFLLQAAEIKPQGITT